MTRDIHLGNPISDDISYFNPLHNLCQHVNLEHSWDLDIEEL